MLNLKQGAKAAGISEGLLVLWIATGKFKPSVSTSLKSDGSSKPEERALAAYAGKGEEAFGWSRYALTEADVERLRKLVEETAQGREQTATKHQKGAAYTVAELALLWSLSVDTVRALFKDEPGVIKISKPAKKGRRAYVNLRIPETVAARVERRLA
jgi:hypothetical protein